MMRFKAVYIIAGCLLAAAAFMKFAMIGYSFLALVLCAIAAAMVLFTLLPTAGKVVLALAITVFMSFFLYWEFQIVKAAKCEPPKNADYLIVLGCGVRGTTPSIAMRNRTDAAARYLLENPQTVAVCSGGQGTGEDISEASAMKTLLLAAGVDETRILMEDRSTSTEENLVFSVEMIKDHIDDEKLISTSSIVICSSEYHIFRAQYMTEYLFEQETPPLQLPFSGLGAHSTLPVSRINYFMREAAGMLAVKLLRK